MRVRSGKPVEARRVSVSKGIVGHLVDEEIRKEGDKVGSDVKFFVLEHCGLNARSVARISDKLRRFRP